MVVRDPAQCRRRMIETSLRIGRTNPDTRSTCDIVEGRLARRIAVTYDEIVCSIHLTVPHGRTRLPVHLRPEIHRRHIFHWVNADASPHPPPTISLLVVCVTSLLSPDNLFADCTSFCFTLQGKPFFATNYDFPDAMQEGLVFVNKRSVTKRGWTFNIPNGWKPNTTSESAKWTSKYGSLTFNLAGYQLVWAGMNERGLTVSTMFLRNGRTHPVGLSSTDRLGCSFLRHLPRMLMKS